MFAVMKGRRLFPCAFAITEMRGIGLYGMPLSMSLLGFGMGTMLANFHMCGNMLVLRAVFNMPVNLSCGECDVISFYLMCCSVNGSVCLVCCVFYSVCELFGETIRNMFGCGCYFVVECYGSV